MDPYEALADMPTPEEQAAERAYWEHEAKRWDYGFWIEQQVGLLDADEELEEEE